MFIIYSKNGCANCDRATDLLNLHGKLFVIKTLDVDYTTEELKKMVPGARSLPQIFHNATYVGGITQLRQYITRGD